MVYKFFDKKSSGGAIKPEPNYQIANELHRQINRKFRRRKVYSSFRDNIWGVDLADMQSLSKYNKRIRYLLWAIDLLSKYTWVVALKDKRGITTVNAYQKIQFKQKTKTDSSNRKPNKIWVDQSGELYTKLFKRFLKKNNIEIYSVRIQGKSAVAERFVRTFKSKIFKHMIAISKSV